jgi:hypothetical protein
MMNEIWTRHLGLATICFGAVGTAIYYVMITITLAHIQTLSGHVPFDMRPSGYGPQEAAQMLESLGAEGRAYYLRAQLPLDAIYPAVLALTLISAMRWFGQNHPTRRLVRVGTLLAVCAAIFDYVENLGIAAMILSWPNLSAPLVYATSAATIAKSVTTTVAVLITLLTVCQWAWPRKAVRNM